jgi:putative membrane protein
MPENFDFSKPERQAPVAILFLVGDTLRLLVRQLWVVILAILFNPKRNVFDGFSFIIIGLGVLSGVGSILSWFRYYYYIKNGELILEKGLFRKLKLTIPFDRIQSVNVKQGPLQQFFNVVAMEIETAGSANREFYLHAISKQRAESLRFILDEHRNLASASRELPLVNNEFGGQEDYHAKVQRRQPAIQPVQSLLFRLNLTDLLKVGVSQNHIRTAGFILAFFLSFYDDLEDALGIDTSKEIGTLLGMESQINFAYYLMIVIPVFLILSFVLTLARTVLKYFNLEFWQTPNGFKMSGGLLTKEEFTINFRKIQFLQWDSSPLKKMFGMVSVKLPQAVSMVLRKNTAGNIPGCSVENLGLIRNVVFGETMIDSMESHGVSERIVFRQLIFNGFLPVVLLMIFTWSWLKAGVWIWLLLLPFAWFYGKRYHKNWLWQVNNDGLLAQWGVFGRRTVLLPWYKVQAISLQTSWFLEKRGLVSLLVFTAGGAIKIPFIAIEKASALQDFVLYKIETDTRNWM